MENSQFFTFHYTLMCNVYAGQTLMQPSTHSLLVVVGEHNICDGTNEGGQVGANDNKLEQNIPLCVFRLLKLNRSM